MSERNVVRLRRADEVAISRLAARRSTSTADALSDAIRHGVDALEGDWPGALERARIALPASELVRVARVLADALERGEDGDRAAVLAAVLAATSPETLAAVAAWESASWVALRLFAAELASADVGVAAARTACLALGFYRAGALPSP